MVQKRSFIFAFTAATLGLVASACLFPRAAHSAGRIDGAEALFRLERRSAAARLVHIEGHLSCAVTEAHNTGTACQLMIQEAAGDRSFVLTDNGGQAMELFQAGTRKVAIEGTLSDNGMLAPIRVSQVATF